MRLAAALQLCLSMAPSLAVEPGVRGRLESPTDHLPLLRGGPHRLLHLGAAFRQVTPLLPLRPWAELVPQLVPFFQRSVKEFNVQF